LFGAVGTTIANSLNTAIYAFRDFNIEFDATNLGESIAAGINEFFENFDAEALAEGFNAFADNVRDTLTATFKNIKWGSILGSIGTFLKNLDGDTILMLIGVVAIETFGKNAAKKLGAKIASTIAENITFTGLAKAVGTKIAEAIASNETLSFILIGIGDLLGDIAVALGGVLVGGVIVFTIGLALSYVWTNSEAQQETKEKIGSRGSTTFTSSDAGANLDFQAQQAVASGTSEWWNENKDDYKQAGEDIGTALQLGMQEKWSETKRNVKLKIKTLGDNIKTWWENNKPSLNISIPDLWASFKQKFEDFKNKIKLWWENNKPSLNISIPDLWASFKQKFEDFKNKIKLWWQNNKPSLDVSIPDLWASLKQKIQDLKDNIVWWWAWNKPKLGINFDVSSFQQSIKDALNKVVYCINVGILYKWNSNKIVKTAGLTVDYLPSFANGGFVSADIFAANENGIPELVGTVGGKTAVASGTEITGIADAVYSTGQTESELLNTAVGLLRIIASKEYGITEREIGNSARNYARDYHRRTGGDAFAF
jgi:hypothetical protein